jgi:hypothetical protein
MPLAGRSRGLAWCSCADFVRVSCRSDSDESLRDRAEALLDIAQHS